MTRLEEFKQRLLVHDAAAGHVDQERAALEVAQALSVQAPGRGRSEGQVHGEEVDRRQELVLGEEPRAGGSERGIAGLQARMMGEDAHAQAAADPGYLPGEAADAEHAQPLAGQLGAGEGVPPPPPGCGGEVGGHEAACQRQHEGQRHFGHGTGGGVAGMDHGHATAAAGL